MPVETIVVVTAASVLGMGLMIGIGLRRLYGREGRSFASWHKRRLLAPLGVALAGFGAFGAVAAGFGLEVAELSAIGAASIGSARLLWNRFRLRGRRGPAIDIARLPEQQASRVLPALAVLSGGLLIAAIVVGGPFSLLEAGRLLAVLQVAVVLPVLAPGRHQLYEGGIQQYTTFVPWDRIESFRYTVFENRTIFSFQLRESRWFQHEVNVGVSRSEALEVSRLLSAKLPRIGGIDGQQLLVPEKMPG